MPSIQRLGNSPAPLPDGPQRPQLPPRVTGDHLTVPASPLTLRASVRPSPAAIIASQAPAPTLPAEPTRGPSLPPATAPATTMTPAQASALASRTAPDALFIGGKWVQPEAGGTLELTNPATGAALGVCPAAGPADVTAAVEAARDAFKAWKALKPHARGGYLLAIADAIAARRDALAQIDVLNVGKPLAEALVDIDDAAKCFRYYAALVRRQGAQGDTILALPDQPAYASRIVWEPRGVVAAIVPWNYPALMATWKVAPALAAGCTVVLKPSELSPWTALELGKIAEEAGLPPGVLNVLPGNGVAGAALTASPGVQCIKFTGSVAMGTQVMKAAADNITPVGLELGGKSPIVVCDDADLDLAVEAVKVGIFSNQGEVCSATSRLIVHEAVAPKLLERLVEAAKGIRLGDGLEPGTQMGPLVSRAQYDKVMGYIEDGKKAGATLLCGGVRPAELPHGYFVAPTIFTDVSPDMRIWREEIFGPVLVVRTFTDDEEALGLANGSEYGLAAAIISRDEARCARFVRGFEAGIVWVNDSQPTFVEAPWSGRKKSGIGVELSYLGLEAYLVDKQVTTKKGTFAPQPMEPAASAEASEPAPHQD
jgi:betaine-aldehyde dehydrogenase